MNVLMILNNPFTHDPRVYNEANSLIEGGHHVTILAWDKTGKHPANEYIDDISIVRSYNSNFMEILPYDILKLHFWWVKGYRDAITLFEKKSFDVVHCHDLASLPIGVKLKKRYNIKLVYDAHEIWGYMVVNDLPKIWAEYYVNFEKRLIKKCDEIILAEDKYVDYFKQFTNKKFTVILNCKKVFLKEYQKPKNKIFTLIYVGTLSSPRFLLELVDVVEKIRNIKCIIGGIGKRKYVQKLTEKTKLINNVEFIGIVPFEKVIPLTLESDVVVCMIDPSNFNNKIATANKQFEAMVCGRPIICTKGTRSGEITQVERCGLTIEYSKQSLKEAIITLRNSPELCEELGKNALNASLETYNWKNQHKKLLALYKKLSNKQ